MTWSTTEIQYDEFPLLLRKPDHINIWQFKDRLTKLVLIEHPLQKVTPNGLPDKKYNKQLADFDNHMCSLIEKTSEGIIFLIETFGGKRIYYYYTLPVFNIDPLIAKAKLKYKVNIEISSQDDKGWGFLSKYPVQIFPI